MKKKLSILMKQNLRLDYLSQIFIIDFNKVNVNYTLLQALLI